MSGTIDAIAVRANRLDLLGRLAGDLAHEIRNPLNSMVVNLELVRRKAATDVELAVQRADIVEAAAEQVHQLVGALLSVLRTDQDDEVADVGGVLRNLAPLVGARARIAGVELDIPTGELGRAAIPPSALAQVLLNLLDNALAVAARGGRILVTTADAGDHVVITVEDSGPGLDAAADPFQPGASTWEGRAGLGLAVCRHLLDTAAGSIDLHGTSELGGACLRVRLPRPGAA